MGERCRLCNFDEKFPRGATNWGAEKVCVYTVWSKRDGMGNGRIAWERDMSKNKHQIELEPYEPLRGLVPV